MICQRCGRYFPDGELAPGRQCSACDEHDRMLEDRCRVCGTLIGIGHPALHLGLCDACRTPTTTN